MNRAFHLNLRKKPHAPSKGRGPVQRAIRRVFMASGAEVLNSTDIYDWAHGRRRFGRRKSMPFGIYSRTLRTLRAMCEPVGRAPTTGRPWLWRLRDHGEPIAPEQAAAETVPETADKSPHDN
jgi:hypothetical protein